MIGVNILQISSETVDCLSHARTHTHTHTHTHTKREREEGNLCYLITCSNSLVFMAGQDLSILLKKKKRILGYGAQMTATVK